METPLQIASAVGNDNIIVQANGSGLNVTVRTWAALSPAHTISAAHNARGRDDSEAALLSAYRADVVPLVGRDLELADLSRWLDDPAPVSVRVLIGVGGVGKTRLALELARAVSKYGWLAGFATAEELDRFRGQGGSEQWRWDRPVLVIIDYAASRAEQIRMWVRELADASLEDRPKLRLLLMERQADRAIGWLAAVFGHGDDDFRAAIAMLNPSEPVILSPLEGLEFRREVFATLLEKSSRTLARADREFDLALAEHNWAGNPLFLMMAGIVAAKTGVRVALSLSSADLGLSIARRELDRIGRIGATHGVERVGAPHGGDGDLDAGPDPPRGAISGQI